MFDIEQLKQYLQQMHQQAPLVHCMTNEVVSNFTANVLLAIGATPAMVIAKEESAEFAKIASSLLINVGTLTANQAEAMRLAVKTAHAQQTPWVLDPVAFGAMQYRSDFCLELLQYKPTIIRGNPAEIAALAGLDLQKSRGPDSLIGSDDALEGAIQLAQQTQAVVALTGETDYVTDGQTTYALNNGDFLLTRVTGTGCSLGAMVAAYCAVCKSPMLAALTALSHMAIAGEKAGQLIKQEGRGVGSFMVALLDQLQLLAQDDVIPLNCQKV